MNVRYLRSAAISTTFSRLLTLFSDIASRGSRSSAAGATVAVSVGRLFVSILHCLIFVGILRGSHGKFGLHIDFLAVQEPVHDLTDAKVSRAEPASIAEGVL
jgi:hypothetical protein